MQNEREREREREGSDSAPFIKAVECSKDWEKKN